MNGSTLPVGHLARAGIAWLVFVSAAVAQFEPPSWKHQLESIYSERHPTVTEFREEIARSDLVVRGRIVQIARRQEGGHPDQDAVIEILRTYKGRSPDVQPCVRMQIIGDTANFMDVPVAYNLGYHLPRVGDEVILPIQLIHARSGPVPPNGQKIHYMAPFFYTVAKDGSIDCLPAFAPDMKPYATLDCIEKMIIDEVNRSTEAPSFKEGELLFQDGFEDGSLAGWIFLIGAQSEVRRGGWEAWIAPTNVVSYDDKRTIREMERDPKTGLYRFDHANHRSVSEIGIINGRLRMRSSRLHRHVTAVIGDPEWTDYQIDVDLYTFSDPTNPDARRGNYLKQGPYGRVHVPNLPETQGEHSFIAVEIGTFGNYDLSEYLFWNHAFQIRCKYAESPIISRDRGTYLRTTKILDFDTWQVPDGAKIHMTVKFFSDYVEGWIDGKKILSAWIPTDHPGAKSGRIALWTFETWSEYDDLKVTRLVPVD